MNDKNDFRRPDFKPGRKDLCFCNSSKRFKSCCGSLSEIRNPPYGVRIVKNFLSDEQCDNWVTRAEKKKRSWLEVVDRDKSTQNEIARKPDPARVTEKVELGDLQEELNAIILQAVLEQIEPVINLKMAWFENSQLLCYTTGGNYFRHADADDYDREKKTFFKIMDRDISMLLYLNDGFTGGSISFPNFNYRYRPTKGDLLFFPSDHRYLHQAEMVTSGVRYAIVSWAALENEPRVMTKPLDGFIAVNRP